MVRSWVISVVVKARQIRRQNWAVKIEHLMKFRINLEKSPLP